MNIENIEEVFEQKKIDDPREAAELAYAIAMIAKNAGDSEKAIRYGRESIALFKGLNVQTLEECSVRYSVINGIALPSSYIHEDVVRNRLKPLEI